MEPASRCRVGICYLGALAFDESQEVSPAISPLFRPRNAAKSSRCVTASQCAGNTDIDDDRLGPIGADAEIDRQDGGAGRIAQQGPNNGVAGRILARTDDTQALAAIAAEIDAIIRQGVIAERDEESVALGRGRRRISQRENPDPVEVGIVEQESLEARLPGRRIQAGIVQDGNAGADSAETNASAALVCAKAGGATATRNASNTVRMGRILSPSSLNARFWSCKRQKQGRPGKARPPLALSSLQWSRRLTLAAGLCQPAGAVAPY